MKDFIDQLRERNVIKVASIYAIASWLILQVTSLTFPLFNISTKIVTGFVILALLMFPACLYLSWKYELILDKGVSKRLSKKSKKIYDREPLPFKGFTNLLLVFGPLVLGLLLLSWISISWLGNIDKHKLSEIKRFPIAVLEFSNETGLEENAYIGKLAAEMISGVLMETGNAKIVPSGFLLEHDEHLESQKAQFGYSDEFASNTGLKNVIEGKYFLIENSIEVWCEFVDAFTGLKHKSFTASWPIEKDARDGLNDLCQQIVGYWLTKDHPLFSLKSPKGDAYKEYYEALNWWNKDYGKALSHLNKAISIDSTFTRAYLMRIEAYLNGFRKFELCDSLIQRLENSNLEFNQQEKDLLNYYKARILGNNRLAYDFFKKEFNRIPEDLFVNYSAMSESLLALNNSKEVIKMARYIDEDEINYSDCFYCRDRLALLVSALIENKKYNKALKLIRKISLDPYPSDLKQLECRVLARKKDYESIDLLLKNARHERFTDNRDYIWFYYIVSYELALAGEQVESDKYARKLISFIGETPSFRNFNRLSRIYMVMGQYQKVVDNTRLLLDSIESQNLEVWIPLFETKLACALGELGKNDEANLILKKLEKLKNKYDKGTYSYYQSQIHVSMNEWDKCIMAIEDALRRGYLFHWYAFNNDLTFKEIRHSKTFKEALKI